MSRLILAGLLLALPALFSAHTTESFEFPKVLLLDTAALALLVLGTQRALFAYPIAALRSTLDDVRRSKLAWCVLALLISAILSTFTSIAPMASVFGSTPSQHGLVTITSYVMLYFAAFLSCTSYEGMRLMRFALWASVPAMAYYWLQVAGLDPLSWKQAINFYETLRTGGTLGHPNYLSCYLVMTLPIALAERASARSGKRVLDRLVLSGIIASMLGVLVLTQSRGSWQALLAMGLVWFLTTSAPSDRKLLAVITTGLVSWWGIACLALRLLGETKHTVIKGILERVVNFAHLDVPRQEYWLGALRIWRKHPFFGVGTDMFQLGYEHVRSTRYWWADYASAPHRAHNEFLNLLATQGLIGALAGYALVVVLIRIVKKRLAANESLASESLISQTERRQFLMLSCMCTGFLIQELSSFSVVATGALFAVALGILSRHDTAKQPYFLRPGQTASPRLITGRGLGTVALISLGLASFYPLVIKRLVPDLFAHQSVMLSLTSPQAGLVLIDQALVRSPRNTTYLEALGAQASRLADLTTDNAQKKSFRELAVRAFDAAQAVMPKEAGYKYLTGREIVLAVHEKNLKPAAIETAYRMLLSSTELEPNNVTYLTGSAELMLMSGHCNLATVWIKALMERYPEARLTWDLATAQAYCLNDATLAQSYHAKALTSPRAFYSTNARPELDFAIDEPKLKQALIDLEQKKPNNSKASAKAKH